MNAVFYRIKCCQPLVKLTVMESRQRHHGRIELCDFLVFPGFSDEAAAVNQHLLHRTLFGRHPTMKPPKKVRLSFRFKIRLR